MENQSKQPTGEGVPVEDTGGAESNATGGANAEESVDPTVFERAVDTAREGANAAADSLRRGEIMQDATIDPRQVATIG